MTDRRYEDGPADALVIIKELIESGDPHFSPLHNARIKPVFDTKKRESRGRVTFASIEKSSELSRYLTQDEVGDKDGYDYFLIIDKVLWEEIIPSFDDPDRDKQRLIRHELRHAVVDLEAKNPFGLRGHTVEDFHAEIEWNQDDPRWKERFGISLLAKYDELKHPQRTLPLG